jgi:hypothetical protein
MREIAGIARKWVKTPRARRRLLWQAVILAGATRALLRLLPLARLRPTLAFLAERIVPARCHAEEDEIVRALAAVNRRLGGTCLANALAAQALLQRYGYPVTLRIGASWKDGNFAAHAWIERNGDIVVGGPASVVQQYAPFPQLDGWSS